MRLNHNDFILLKKIVKVFCTVTTLKNNIWLSPIHVYLKVINIS